MENPLVFQDTFEKSYAPKRKSLSSVFFKNKLSDMMKTVKMTTVGELKDWQSTMGQPFSLDEKIRILQSKIILNCAFGTDVITKSVVYENEKGVEEMVPII